MSSRTPSPGNGLHPARALVHPLWLGCLATLALNDHVLKGASWLPPAVTGKLSDLAGLVVAPVLLAALVRVRSRRGWWASHVAVGAVFSAIQLSSAAATGWSALMGAFGFPWVITRDPTDLWALPALLLSALGLEAATRRARSTSARRSAEVAAAGTGLLCCAATSPAPGEPFIPELWTDVYVHNAGDEPIIVRTRDLAPSVDLDCDAVAEDPGRLLTEPLFGLSESFRLDPDQNFGLRINNEWEQWDEWDDNGDPTESPRECYAIRLDVDGLPRAVAFWRVGQVPMEIVEGFGAAPNARGIVELHPSDDPDTLGRYEQPNEQVLFTVPPAEPPVVGACAPQGDGGRLFWSEPLPWGTKELIEVNPGADGCYSLDLGIRNPAGEIIDRDHWFLCVPLSDLGLEPGRLVNVSALAQGIQGEGGIIVRTDDHADDGPELPVVQLQAYRGPGFPNFHGLRVSAIPAFDCGHAVAPTCGTVIRATSATAGGGPFEVVALPPGGQQTLAGDDRSEMTVALAHAEQRAALDPECAEGPDALGLDLEVVALYVEPAAG